MTPTRKRKSPTFRGIPIQYEPAIRVLHPKRKRKTGRVFIVNAQPSAKRLHVWSLVNEGDGRARVVFQQTGGARWVLIEPGNYGKEAVRFLNAAIKEHALATRSLSRRKATK